MVLYNKNKKEKGWSEEVKCKKDKKKEKKEKKFPWNIQP